jgi:hypothetical protein
MRKQTIEILLWDREQWREVLKRGTEKGRKYS